MPADKIATAVYAEQLRAIFRQMPIALAVNLVNAALTAIVLSRIAAGPLPAIWFLAVVLVTHNPELAALADRQVRMRDGALA